MCINVGSFFIKSRQILADGQQAGVRRITLAHLHYLSCEPWYTEHLERWHFTLPSKIHFNQQSSYTHWDVWVGTFWIFKSIKTWTYFCHEMVLSWFALISMRSSALLHALHHFLRWTTTSLYLSFNQESRRHYITENLAPGTYRMFTFIWLFKMILWLFHPILSVLS